MLHQENDKRLTDILDMIGCIASLDFSKELTPSDRHDMIDAISIGLNMLSEELNTQVVDKVKLDEVNRKLEKFAYTTAHDLKSPLNSQNGLIQLLEMSLKNANPEAKEYISRLKQMNEKMKSLVEGILAYSVAHFKDVKKEEVDWNELLREVMEVDNTARQADVHVSSRLPVVFFNKTAAIQIIRNLLDNAIKYTDKKRCVVTIHTTDMKDHFQVSFTDNGPGIALAYHEKIFELFNQVEPSLNASSVGVGLSTVKGIIEAAGEKIWLKSSPGNGASFIFTLTKNP